MRPTCADKRGARAGSAARTAGRTQRARRRRLPAPPRHHHRDPDGDAPGGPRARIAALHFSSLPLEPAAHALRAADIPIPHSSDIAGTRPCSARSAKAIFGSSNERYVKSLDKIVRHDQRARAAARELQRRGAGGADRQVPRAARRRARRSTTSSPKPSPPCARRPSACSACATSTCRWSAASCSTAARSPRCAPARARPWSATLATYLNAIEGKGVHVVTVNDYLARRDAEWMGQIHRFLGLTVGVIVPNLHRARAPRGLSTRTSPTAPTTSSASTTCATT